LRAKTIKFTQAPQEQPVEENETRGRWFTAHQNKIAKSQHIVQLVIQRAESREHTIPSSPDCTRKTQTDSDE